MVLCGGVIMPIKKRLINCDFFVSSGFTSISNKAKLLYFYFLTNADDKGFVGNGKDIADTLDQCEESFDNVLFNYKYKDALSELVDRHLVIPFVDKCNNVTYLIRHWFMHNKNQGFLTTNYVSYLAKVELVDDEYHLKTIERENPLKGKEIKGNEIKQNQKSILNKSFKNDIDSDTNTSEEKEKEQWEKDWDDVVKYLNETPFKGN